MTTNKAQSSVGAKELERRLVAFRSECRAAGVKLTHQRLRIFEHVASVEDHPSAEAVLSALRPELPTVSLDTVYRTLWLLEDLGLLSALAPRRNPVRFDANPRPHHHFVCTRCGLVRDFEDPTFDALEVPAAVRSWGTVKAARVEVRGICVGCSKRPVGRRSAKEGSRCKGS